MPHPITVHGEPPSGGFSGQVQELSLVDVLQLYHHTRRSIRVSLEGPISGEVVLSSGEIAHAECEGLRGLGALTRLLSANTGTIRTLPAAELEQRSIEGSFAYVLLEASRRLDEARQPGYVDTLTGKPPSLSPPRPPASPAWPLTEPAAEQEDPTVVDVPFAEWQTPLHQAASRVPIHSAHARLAGRRGERRQLTHVSDVGLELEAPYHETHSPVHGRPSARALAWVSAALILLLALGVLVVTLRDTGKAPIAPPAPPPAAVTGPAEATLPAPDVPSPVERTAFNLTLATKPRGASVIEDGKVIGTSPLTIEIARSSVAATPRRFLLRRAGYAVAEHRQSDSSEDTSVVLVLAKSSSQVAVKALLPPPPAARPAEPAPLDIRLRR